ncbi:MAG TPA: alpha-1,2-fucosyltransferase, partial [Anaerolineae bacterium]|nr:alpha-1,2-fucosyltransferase [Anaerolineae bacterium]
MSMANRARLLIDASGFAGILRPNSLLGERTLELDRFRISGQLVLGSSAVPVARGEPPRSWTHRKALKYWKKLLGIPEHIKPYYERRVVREPEENHFRFDAKLYNRRISSEVTFIGYWQTERYFAEIAPLLRTELAVVPAMEGQNVAVARSIAACDSVAVHVRHGDNVKAAAALGVLAPAYYERAFTAICSEVAQPRFFVFSDDPEWARSVLRTPGQTTYVAHNSPHHSYEDLRLMTLCKHHIIANSTF